MSNEGNLVVERANGDYLISSKGPFQLISFADLGPDFDETENGQIRIHKSSAVDDLMVIQFRAKQRLKFGDELKNLRAVARITGAELKRLCNIALDVAGVIEVNETDALHSRIQDLEEEVKSLNILLKDFQDHVHEAMEG